MALVSLHFPHGFVYQPGHHASPRKPGQNNSDQWHKGLWYLFGGFLRRLSKYSIGRFIFKSQSKTKLLIVISASLPKVSLSCFQRVSKRITQTQDLARALGRRAREQGQWETSYISTPGTESDQIVLRAAPMV